jgi:hypothetical protein
MLEHNLKGVAILEVGAGGLILGPDQQVEHSGSLIVKKHPDQQVTPIQVQNAAQVIVGSLGFANPGSLPARVTPPPSLPPRL